MRAFTILEHPSDLGIQVRGNSFAEVLHHSALGLLSIIAGDSKIHRTEVRQVIIQALDRENLLVRWLSEILFLFDAQKFLYADLDIFSLTDTELTGVLYGEQYDPARHTLHIEVKAITYHGLKLEEQKNNWLARIFIDI